MHQAQITSCGPSVKAGLTMEEDARFRRFLTKLQLEKEVVLRAWKGGEAMQEPDDQEESAEQEDRYRAELLVMHDATMYLI
jgi:hypothetical protein